VKISKTKPDDAKGSGNIGQSFRDAGGDAIFDAYQKSDEVEERDEEADDSEEGHDYVCDFEQEMQEQEERI